MMAMEAKSRRPRRNIRKKSKSKSSSLLHQTIYSYITFGYQSTACLGCFVALYALLMVCILPMLQTTPSENSPMGPLEGARLPTIDVVKNHPRLAQAASKLRSQFRQWREGSGVTDKSLLRESAAEFAVLRKRQHLSRENNAALQMKVREKVAGVQTPGVIVLAMHRSGTSMLSGLLVNGIGYNVGGPLIGAAFDNEKGFFERIDVVLQNDEFLKSQQMWWGGGIRSYDSDKAYDGYKSGSIRFTEGSKGLKFLKDTNNAPWLQKDPRMCITLRTWLRILEPSPPPAIVFTYRHPMEVAMSLKTREQNFSLELGLRLWIIYNTHAIQNSQGLCRVVTTNENILKSPLQEIQYIADELTNKCHLPAGTNRITQEQVDQFIDPTLQHNTKNKENQRILETIGGDHNCHMKDYVSEYETGSEHHNRELSMYKTAMKIFCDLDSHKAFEQDYHWPTIP